MYDIFQVNNEDGNRHYEITHNKKTNKYKSVTTLINHFKPKTGLLEWKARVGEKESSEITKKASNRGSSVHKTIDIYFNNKQCGNFSQDVNNLEEENKIYFNKLLPVLENITPIYIEHKTFWQKDDVGFAGTLDICGLLDASKFTSRESGSLGIEPIPFIGDWKTWNKAKYPVSQNRKNEKYYPLISYYLQLAAYCAAVNQRTNCEHKLNKAFIFGVTETCRQPFIYYLNKECINFYWNNMKELVYCYYNKSDFDWLNFEKNAHDNNYLGERIDFINS